MVSRSTWTGIMKYGQEATKTASSFLRSGWTKAAIASVGTGAGLSYAYSSMYVPAKKESLAADTQAEAERAATETRTMYAREYILERERNVGQSPFSAGSTPSGQFNFSGIISLLVIGVIGYVVIKYVGTKK